MKLLRRFIVVLAALSVFLAGAAAGENSLAPDALADGMVRHLD